MVNPFNLSLYSRTIMTDLTLNSQSVKSRIIVD